MLGHIVLAVRHSNSKRGKSVEKEKSPAPRGNRTPGGSRLLLEWQRPRLPLPHRRLVRFVFSTHIVQANPGVKFELLFMIISCTATACLLRLKVFLLNISQSPPSVILSQQTPDWSQSFRWTNTCGRVLIIPHQPAFPSLRSRLSILLLVEIGCPNLSAVKWSSLLLYSAC